MSKDLDNNKSRAENTSAKNLDGLLITYEDDRLNECVRSPLKRKSRVKYKCMDTILNFLAFGASSGAIYLYKLDSAAHSICTLASVIPCDQGSIEVIRFLANPHLDDLLVAVGTSRGSIVVFRLNQLDGDQSPICLEIYKAVSFTNNSAISLLEYDHDLFDPCYSFSKLYICDTANRLYVLESSAIYSSKQTMRLFYTNHLPSLIFSANESRINQISIHRAQLLISTDETTRLFNEQSNQIELIGKKKRKEGFYGACFFNPDYKPTRVLRIGQSNQQVNQSTNSLFELDNLLMFVSRPMFRLWQVNHQRSVVFTHQFDPQLKSSQYFGLIKLHNKPIEHTEDNPFDVMKSFSPSEGHSDHHKRIKSDHFQRLVPIYSSTLGNLLMSYTQNEIYVVDPIRAKLIVWYHQDEPIVQVCCNENELFVWSSGLHGEKGQFRVNRLVLLAPTQFVLELHRVHRFLTIIVFVQMFAEVFRSRMALPLSGPNVITTEGGLLRNVLLNAWDMHQSTTPDDLGPAESLEEFKSIVNEIIEESSNLRHSLENLSDSRFFLAMTSENIDRLCSEPYASLVSLEVSISDLHTNHVIHFNKDALNRHKSVANLPQSIQKLNQMNQRTMSSIDLSGEKSSSLLTESANKPPTGIQNSKVIVERQRPRKLKKQSLKNYTEVDHNPECIQLLSIVGNERSRIPEITEGSEADLPMDDPSETTEHELESRRRETLSRCSNCLWPRQKSHLIPMHSSQMIQLKWIEEKLIRDFPGNVAQIEDLALKHGLWPLFLKCLAYRGKFDDYITCCMILDDVRLLDFEQFGDDSNLEAKALIDKLFAHLERGLDVAPKSGSSELRSTCFRCNANLDSLDTDYLLAQIDEHGHGDRGDAFSFNLANCLEQLLMNRNAEVNLVIQGLLGYPKLLNSSKIPVNFYLKTIATAALAANQSPLSKARMSQLHGID